MKSTYQAGDVVYFTHPARKQQIGVIIRHRLVEGEHRYHVKPYRPELRPYTPPDADLLYLPGELFIAMPGKLLSVSPGQIKPTRHKVDVATIMKRKPTAKAPKKAATPKKRPMTAKGRTYLDRLHTLTQSIHKASDTGETRTVKVYGLSWGQAEKQAIRKLKTPLKKK